MRAVTGRAGAFVTTLCAFFLAEIGDKTQIATIGLAARFATFYPVVVGTTLGMMLANIPAVLIADRLPVKAIRITAAIVFAALGVLTLVGVGGKNETDRTAKLITRGDTKGLKVGCAQPRPGWIGRLHPNPA
jgi:putative Ca2+/H+ antiporter (TMEM165/GDT1 family)